MEYIEINSCIVEYSDKLNQLFGPAVIKKYALQKTL